MGKNLPSRPNLDHLRRQAKSLLASLASGDAEAEHTFQEFLPAAQGQSAPQVRAEGYRLADAQSAIARKSGFASWPRLARHVEQLRALEGVWTIESLQVDGQSVPPSGLKSSRILIDGDRFRTESPEATYEGVFNIDVEPGPHHLDIDFVEGPEAGNRNLGIFALDGDRLEICLDLNGEARPTAFASAPKSGHAYEVLRRTRDALPDDVKGGTKPDAARVAPPVPDATAFGYVASPTLDRLQGDWTATRIVRDGAELPASMLSVARRSAMRNELTISIGGRNAIEALVRVNETTSPVEIDYLNIGGMAKGTVQHGIMEWRSGEACFCMAAPGQPRPTDFTSEAASGRTLSCWRFQAAPPGKQKG